jgi:tRNA-specific 2-thiouridylase
MADAEALRAHMSQPLGLGHLPAGALVGSAGGSRCGDLISIALSAEAQGSEQRIADAGFQARGCGALTAAGSAVVALVRGQPLSDAARLSAQRIAAELGGLSAPKLHAAELAEEALHRALGRVAWSARPLRADPGRVLVAMSGGVDSAVAALLLARSGMEVVGVTLELWRDQEGDGERSCCSAHAVRGARALAHALGLAHLTLDLRAAFRDRVVQGWIDAHRAGLTPNPCITCNGALRIDAMLALASALGAATLATGHYARLGELPACALREGGQARKLLLRCARDLRKDQSYALAALAPERLARLRFPLGDLTKEEVRAIAARAGLAVADRPDSQDLCFLAGTSVERILERHGGIRASSGPIEDQSGRRVGSHKGLCSYTVGQRRGLGLGGQRPQFVLAIDAVRNALIVGEREALLSGALAIEQLQLHLDPRQIDAVRIRSRGGLLAGALALSPTGTSATFRLAAPAERTAPGQVAVLYCGDLVAGHGVLARSRQGAGRRAGQAAPPGKRAGARAAQSLHA